MTSSTNPPPKCGECKETMTLGDISELRKHLCNSCAEDQLRRFFETNVKLMPVEIAYMFDRIEHYRAIIRKHEREMTNA